MLFIREMIYQAGNPPHPNEDSFGQSGDGRVSVVVDGLTSKEPNRDSYRYLGMNDSKNPLSDVAYVARALVHTLTHDNYHRIACPVAVLNKARIHLREDFNHRAIQMPVQQAEFPMCAVGMVRERPNGMIELTSVGDVEIGIVKTDGSEIYLHADPVHTMYEKIRAIESKRLSALGIHDTDEKRKRILPLMASHYNHYTNVPGGFGMFSLNRDLIPEVIRTVSIPAQDVREVRLYTDGLASWYDHNRPDGARFVKNAPSLQEMYRQVRECENGNRPTSYTGRSFKKSDDATGLVLQWYNR